MAARYTVWVRYASLTASAIASGGHTLCLRDRRAPPPDVECQTAVNIMKSRLREFCDAAPRSRMTCATTTSATNKV